MAKMNTVNDLNKKILLNEKEINQWKQDSINITESFSTPIPSINLIIEIGSIDYHKNILLRLNMEDKELIDVILHKIEKKIYDKEKEIYKLKLLRDELINDGIET